MKVLLADDQSEIRSALRLLLEQEPGISVAGEAGDTHELLEKAARLRPEIVLLDWELADPPLTVPAADCGLVLLDLLRSVCPSAAVIALSGRPEARAEALSAGADGFISKGEPPECVIDTVRGVARRLGSIEGAAARR